MKTSNPNNSIVVHVEKSQNSIDWSGARVVKSVKGYWERRAVEAIEIRRSKSSMNQDKGLLLPSLWNPVFRSNLTSPHPLLLLPHPSQLFTFNFCNSHVLYSSHVTLNIISSHLSPHSLSCTQLTKTSGSKHSAVDLSLPVAFCSRNCYPCKLSTTSKQPCKHSMQPQSNLVIFYNLVTTLYLAAGDS